MLALLFRNVFTMWNTSMMFCCWIISHTLQMAQKVPLRPPPFLNTEEGGACDYQPWHMDPNPQGRQIRVSGHVLPASLAKRMLWVHLHTQRRPRKGHSSARCSKCRQSPSLHWPAPELRGLFRRLCPPRMMPRSLWTGGHPCAFLQLKLLVTLVREDMNKKVLLQKKAG